MAMTEKYFGGTLPAGGEADEIDNELIEMASSLRDVYEAKMEKYAFQDALMEIFKVLSRANKYIDETAPWVLGKDESKKARLAKVMYNLLESIRICTILLKPFIPQSCEKIFAQIGADEALTGWDAANVFGAMAETVTVHRGENIFPRIDLAKELEALEAINAAKQAPAEEPAEEEVKAAAPINFDDFLKVEMKVVKVLTCEKVKKSDKLLKFTLDDGSGEERVILSGIAKYYTPEELVGKTLVACTNLAPRKMMGQESRGMLLSAEKNGELNLVMLDDKIPAGAVLC